MSAQVTGLEILQPTGRIMRMILPQHGENDLKRNPNIAADEYKLLKILENEGLSVPSPYYFQQAGGVFTKPCILIDMWRASQILHHPIQHFISSNWQLI
ncbi:hypothetical protein [Peribacillus muralis]|uniref:hypothetical protein n=1 Tax=Peribacillus muralis TaxID=264697 RepID=UPI003D084854